MVQQRPPGFDAMSVAGSEVWSGEEEEDGKMDEEVMLLGSQEEETALMFTSTTPRAPRLLLRGPPHCPTMTPTSPP